MTAVLHAAGIRCETPVIPPDLPAHVHETFGWVARESVTNVLRHSTATWCLLTVWADDGRVHLEIVNDGVGRLLGGVPGSGLAGLTERIENVGGEFTAGQVGDGTFRIAAEVPIKVST
jgi:two-component system sensor histidine kinase DesK